MALSAVVITKGTDMTNQIEAENHDFKIMTDISSGTISQYPTEETYFPEDLIEKMTGLDGVPQFLAVLKHNKLPDSHFPSCS